MKIAWLKIAMFDKMKKASISKNLLDKTEIFINLSFITYSSYTMSPFLIIIITIIIIVIIITIIVFYCHYH